jgi:adenosylcobinamide-GDP ribazoletransferase
VTSFFAALQFLLVTPAFIRRSFTAAEMGQAIRFYPLVGLLLGVVLVAADALLGLLWPIPVRSALILALWVVATGGFHLDGFLDSCDGLLGGSTTESRMEIMRDERVGAFGLAGGVLLLLVMYSSLWTIASGRWAALLLAPVLGRLGMSFAIAALPYARPSGLGRDIKDHARMPDAMIAAVIAAAIAALVALLAQSVIPIFALLAGALAYWLSTRFILGRIPGMTGDTYGAINMLIEAATLLTFAVIL